MNASREVQRHTIKSDFACVSSNNDVFSDDGRIIVNRLYRERVAVQISEKWFRCQQAVFTNAWE